MSLGGLDPVPKIDPRCKWYHLLSDSTWRRTYSSVITDQQRRDRSQPGERSHRSRLGARTERLGYRIKIQSQASLTRQVGFQEVGSLSASLVLSNNLPWREVCGLSLCPVMARVRFSQQGHGEFPLV